MYVEKEIGNGNGFSESFTHILLVEEYGAEPCKQLNFARL